MTCLPETSCTMKEAPEVEVQRTRSMEDVMDTLDCEKSDEENDKEKTKEDKVCQEDIPPDPLNSWKDPTSV